MLQSPGRNGPPTLREQALKRDPRVRPRGNPGDPRLAGGRQPLEGNGGRSEQERRQGVQLYARGQQRAREGERGKEAQGRRARDRARYREHIRVSYSPERF